MTAFTTATVKNTSLCLLFGFSLFIEHTAAQNVGVGTSNPLARLHVSDSAVVFSANGYVPSIPGNPPVSGQGRRMMWYPDKAAFRVGFVTSTQWDKDSIGLLSFATSMARATGLNSIALGVGAIARDTNTFATGASVAVGRSSTAMGGATAVGLQSIAMGQQARSLGWYSTAVGPFTTAKAWGATAVGFLNDTTDTPSPGSPLPLDRIFQIGNADIYAGGSRNAMTVLRNGNVGIGTTTPISRLHVSDSAVVFSANGFVPAYAATGSPPISGPGRRMMWYPDKAAFRVGYVDGTQWDKDSIGYLSFATSMAKAIGLSSIALGQGSVAREYYSLAIGGSIASGYASTAIGQAIAPGYYSVAIGHGATSSGWYSTAIGPGTLSKAWGAIAVGSNNDTTDTPSGNPGPLDRIFQIGNGAPTFSGPSNAMTVLRNGNVGIATTTPGFPLNFSNTLGDKIALWGNGGSHYGFGVQSYLLQIHTDMAGSDIAFGYGSSGSFLENLRIKGTGVLQFPQSRAKKIIFYPGEVGDANIGVFANELRISSEYSGADITFGYDNRSTGYTEKFRMKANGALAINGNTGNAGQVIQSNGSNASAGWVSPTNLLFNNMYSFNQTGQVVIPNNTGVNLVGIAGTITISNVSKVMLSFYAYGSSLSCAFCGGSTIEASVGFIHNSNPAFNWTPQVAYATVPNGSVNEMGNGFFIGTLQPGVYSLFASAQNVGSTAQLFNARLSLVIVPQ